MRKRLFVVWSFIIVLGSGVVSGSMTVREAGTPAENAATLDQWLGDIGLSLAEVEHFQDFEVGFIDGENIHDDGSKLSGGLVIRDTGSGTPAATVRSSPAYFGGSNPIDTYALAHDEEQWLELDFSLRPVDYVSLYDIDHDGTDVKVTFVGGAVFTYSLDIAKSSGDTAEFFGIYRNDQPRIAKIEFDASGDGEWGVDNIRYGVLHCVVDLKSFALFAQQWLEEGESLDADLDDSGGVDILDLELFLDYWMDDCPPDWPL